MLEKEMVLYAPNTIKITGPQEALSEPYELLVEIIISTSTSINVDSCYKQFYSNSNVKKSHCDFIK